MLHASPQETSAQDHHDDVEMKLTSAEAADSRNEPSENTQMDVLDGEKTIL